MLTAPAETVMDCKEFNRLIPEYLDHRLGERKLKEFLNHYDECEDCRDELKVQYLIYEGLERLEEGDAFDVEKDLADMMEIQKKQLRASHGIQMTAIAAEIITTAAFTIVLFVVLFYQ